MEGEGKNKKDAEDVSKMGFGDEGENIGIFDKGGNAKMVVKE